MDFITGLPRTPKNHDTIWVVVDKMSKTAHFIPIKMYFKLDTLNRLSISQIVSLHGVPSSIVFEKDPRFTSKFWKAL